MKLSFRSKILAAHLALVAAVLLLVFLELNRSLAIDLHEQRSAKLEQQAQGAATWVRQSRHPEKLAGRLATVVGARVTIVDLTGAVVGDSREGVVGSDANALPEIAAARTNGVGRATRDDANGSVTFVAVPATDELVVRVGAPLADVEGPLDAMRGRLLYASVLAVLVAILLAVLASRVAARPLRAMTEAAEGIARGDYDRPLPPASPDEFGRLSSTLAALATQLSSDMTRIRQLEAIRRDFVANLSHELRTPVTAIQGYAETLMSSPRSEKDQRRYVEIMHRHAARISTLVSALLRLSEIEARTPSDRVQEPVDVGAIAEHVANSMRPRAEEREVLIELDLPKRLTARGDPLGVEQIIDNLVDNALKYGGSPGAVHIGGKVVGDRVLLTVSDEGPGIEEEHLPRLFERFYRVDKGRSREEGGTGLGLSIVKHLVESMEGNIRVTSEVGHGTTFDVELPLLTS